MAHACKLRGMEFQENPSHGSRNTAEEELLSQSKVPVIINRSQPNLLLLLRMRIKCKVSSLQENAFSGSRDTAEQILLFSKESSPNY